MITQEDGKATIKVKDDINFNKVEFPDFGVECEPTEECTDYKDAEDRMKIAAMAMQGMLARERIERSECVKGAVLYADALLEELKK